MWLGSRDLGFAKLLDDSDRPPRRTRDPLTIGGHGDDDVAGLSLTLVVRGGVFVSSFNFSACSCSSKQNAIMRPKWEKEKEGGGRELLEVFRFRQPQERESSGLCFASPVFLSFPPPFFSLYLSFFPSPSLWVCFQLNGRKLCCSVSQGPKSWLLLLLCSSLDNCGELVSGFSRTRLEFLRTKRADLEKST